MGSRYLIECSFDFRCYDAGSNLLVSGLASAQDYMLAALALSRNWIRATELRDFMGVQDTSGVTMSFARHQRRAPGLIQKKTEGRCNYYRIDPEAAWVLVDETFYTRLREIVSHRDLDLRPSVIEDLRRYMRDGQSAEGVTVPVEADEISNSTSTGGAPKRRSSRKRRPDRLTNLKHGDDLAFDPDQLDRVSGGVRWMLRLCALCDVRGVPLPLIALSAKALFEGMPGGRDQSRVNDKTRERELRMLGLPGLLVNAGLVSMSGSLQRALLDRTSDGEGCECLRCLALALDASFSGSEDYTMLAEREGLMPHVFSVRKNAKERSFSSQGLGDLMNDVGLYLLKVGEPAEALGYLEEGHEHLFALFGDSDENTANSLANIGLFHLGRSDPRVAREYFEKARDALARFYGGENEPNFEHPNLSHEHYNIALASRLLDEWSEARAHMERAVVMVDAREQTDGTDISVARALARAVLAEAVVREALQHPMELDLLVAKERALGLMAEAEAMVSGLAENDWTRARVAEWHALLQEALGNKGEAVKQQRRAIKILRAGPRPNPQALARYRNALKAYVAMP